MNWVYFDLETERTAEEVGGWRNIEQLGITVAVTCSTADDLPAPGRVLSPEDLPTAHFQHRVFLAHQVQELLAVLQKCDGVIGFNTRGFDFRVLQPFADFDVSALPNLDLMLDLKEVAGFRPGLENCCAATFGKRKSSDGLEALRWWREGRHQDVIDYCKDDVSLTRLLHEYGAKNGFIQCLTREGILKTLPVQWSLNYLAPPPAQGTLF